MVNRINPLKLIFFVAFCLKYSTCLPQCEERIFTSQIHHFTANFPCDPSFAELNKSLGNIQVYNYRFDCICGGVSYNVIVQEMPELRQYKPPRPEEIKGMYKSFVDATIKPMSEQIGLQLYQISCVDVYLDGILGQEIKFTDSQSTYSVLLRVFFKDANNYCTITSWNTQYGSYEKSKKFVRSLKLL